MPLTQRAALTAALSILGDLRSEERCKTTADGSCRTHGWDGATKPGCPQTSLNALLEQLALQGGTEAPYSALTLEAMLRGCTQYQEVHVRFAVNGYTHRGRLGLHDGITSGSRFYVDTAHGDRVERLRALDILEADVCARDLRGVPLDPRHDPK